MIENTNFYAAVKEKVQVILKAGTSLPQGVLIHRLNPIIRGWAYFYRHVVSKQIYYGIDHAIWHVTWNWATRRHPRKHTLWIKDRYYLRKEGREWVFTDGKAELFAMSSLPIRRHFPLRGEANPYGPDWAAYFQRRATRQGPLRLDLPEWVST